ncbi:C-factor [Metarhizium anisopliae]|nr:C-factor [Metarhizium anisopliae]
MSTVLVTGGGRGIGLELVRQLVQLPESRISLVLVTTRGPSQPLDELISSSAGRIVQVQCEITDDNSVKQAAAVIEAKLAGKGLDILINNVGIMSYTEGRVGALDGQQLLTAFDVNVLSTHRITAALIPLLQKGSGKKIAMISTPLGSIDYANRYTWLPVPAYKITKAAMNMLSVQYAIDYEKEGFTVVAVSPGWLRTDMGSQDADLDVATGVRALKDLILSATVDANGKFYNIHVPGWEHAEGPNQYDGAVIPW